MGADSRHRDDLGEVALEQERELTACLGPELLAPGEGMKGEGLSTRMQLRVALGRT